MTPPPIPKHVKENFNTMLKAAKNGQIAAVSAVRKEDQKPVVLVCAMQTNEDETITAVPFAVMIDGNPFELFEDPTDAKEVPPVPEAESL